MVVGPLGSARCQIARLCVLSGKCIYNRQSAGISCGGNLLNRTTNKVRSLHTCGVPHVAHLSDVARN